VVPIRVAGGGFIPGSLCKVIAAGRPEFGIPTTFQSGSALTCTFDLTGVQPATYNVVVVNNGTLRSNTVTFTVLTETPTLSSISPSAGRPGAKLSLTGMGSGFDSTSVIRFNGAPLTTTFISGTQVFGTPLDLTSVAPGSYNVEVVNGGNIVSNPLQFVVTSNPPQLTSMTPVSGTQGVVVALDVIGNGFDNTSVIHVFEPGSPVVDDPVNPTALVSANEVTGSYDLTGKPAGAYRVEVVNAGGLASNALVLQISSNVAVLRTATPGGGPQGNTVSLSLSGDNFFTGAQAHISGNGRPDTALTSTVTPPSGLNVGSLSLAGWDTGTYALTVVNPGAGPSNSVGFTVLAGPPSITATAASRRTTRPAPP